MSYCGKVRVSWTNDRKLIVALECQELERAFERHFCLEATDDHWDRKIDDYHVQLVRLMY
jgi:hypothetical protein